MSDPPVVEVQGVGGQDVLTVNFSLSEVSRFGVAVNGEGVWYVAG